MKAKIFKIGVFFSASLILMGCSIFSPKVIPENQVFIEQTGLNKLEGFYEIFPYLEIRQDVTFKQNEQIEYTNLHSYVGEKSFVFDSTANYSVEVKAISNNSLIFTFKSDETTLEQTEVRGELRNNGLFYLDNTVRDCKGIPYVLGKCYIRKGRIGLNEQNDLLVNIARENFGGFLFFSSGIRTNSTFVYNKIE